MLQRTNFKEGPELPLELHFFIALFLLPSDILSLIGCSIRLSKIFDDHYIWKSLLRVMKNASSHFSMSIKRSTKGSKKISKDLAKAGISKRTFASFWVVLIDTIDNRLRRTIEADYIDALHKSIYHESRMVLQTYISRFEMLPKYRDCNHIKLALIYQGIAGASAVGACYTHAKLTSHMECTTCGDSIYGDIIVCSCCELLFSRYRDTAVFCSRHCAKEKGHYGHNLCPISVPITTQIVPRNYSVGCFSCGFTAVLRVRLSMKLPSVSGVAARLKPRDQPFISISSYRRGGAKVATVDFVCLKNDNRLRSDLLSPDGIQRFKDRSTSDDFVFDYLSG